MVFYEWQRPRCHELRVCLVAWLLGCLVAWLLGCLFCLICLVCLVCLVCCADLVTRSDHWHVCHRFALEALPLSSSPSPSSSRHSVLSLPHAFSPLLLLLCAYSAYLTHITGVSGRTRTRTPTPTPTRTRTRTRAPFFASPLYKRTLRRRQNELRDLNLETEPTLLAEWFAVYVPLDPVCELLWLCVLTSDACAWVGWVDAAHIGGLLACLLCGLARQASGVGPSGAGRAPSPQQ